MAQKVKAPELQWLKILEGEFDNLFRDIQENLSALSECSEEARSLARDTRADVDAVAPVFSQLVLKTIALFQSNRKLKTMLVDTTSELTRAKTQCELLQRELRARRLQVRTLELELRRREGLDQRRWEGLDQRQREGLDQRQREGLDQRQREGLDQRQREGLDQGQREGLDQRRREGLDQGQWEGLDQRQREGLDQRQREGLDQGQREGLDQRQREGLDQTTSSLGTLRAQLELEVERYSQTPLAVERLTVEVAQLQQENGTLHKYFQHLHNELASSRLNTKYLQKELAGRIQQLQLVVSSGMKGEDLRKLWLQINTEINLQKNKALLDAYQFRDKALDKLLLSLEDEKMRMRKLRRKVLHYAALSEKERSVPGPGALRTVTVVKDETGSLGITIAGGKEQELPILVSNMEEGKPAYNSGGLQIGDAILSVNRRSLSGRTHREATQLLQAAQNPVTLEVAFAVGLDLDEEEKEEKKEEEEEEEEIDSGEKGSSHDGKRRKNGCTPPRGSSDAMSANPPQSSSRVISQIPSAQSSLQSVSSSSSSTPTSSTESLSSSRSSQMPARAPAELRDSKRLASAFALVPASPSSSSPEVDLSSVALFQYQDSDSANAASNAPPSDSTLASATVSVPFKTPPSRMQLGSSITHPQPRGSIETDRQRPVSSSHLSPGHGRDTQTSADSFSDSSSFNLALSAVPIQTLNLADFGDEDFPLFST